MKKLLFFCLIVLISSLNIKEQNQNHAQEIVQVKWPRLGDPSCFRYNFKRQTRIQVFNYFNAPQDQLRVDSEYLDSGQRVKKANVGQGLSERPAKISYRRGAYWDYTKTSNTATGSNGLISFIVRNRKIVVFYQNPWSGWPGAGICVMPLNTQVNKDLYKKMYKTMKKYADTISNSKSANVGLFDTNCIYYQDVNAGLKNWDLSKSSILSDIKLSTRVAYRYQDKGTCYQLDVYLDVNK